MGLPNLVMFFRKRVIGRLLLHRLANIKIRQNSGPISRNCNTPALTSFYKLSRNMSEPQAEQPPKELTPEELAAEQKRIEKKKAKEAKKAAKKAAKEKAKQDRENALKK